MKQFGLWLLDIPTLLAFLILMITIYRAKATIHGLKQVSLLPLPLSPPPFPSPSPRTPQFQRSRTTLRLPRTSLTPLPFLSFSNWVYIQLFGKSQPAQGPPAVPALEDNPAPPERAGTWHQVVGVQFAALLLDIPFPILLLLTLWRLPWCVRRIIREVLSCYLFCYFYY